MGKNVLNRALLSMVAASLLTTSAFAKIETTLEVRSDSGLSLNKLGSSEEVFRLTIDNTDPVASELEVINIQLESNNTTDLSYLKDISIFRGNQDVSNLVKSFLIDDANVSGLNTISNNTKIIPMVLDVRDVTSVSDQKTDRDSDGTYESDLKKTEFLNTQNGDPTKYIIVLNFDEINNIDDAEIRVRVIDADHKLSTRIGSTGSYSVNAEQGLDLNFDNGFDINNASTSVSANINKVSNWFKIDTTNPSITNIGVYRPVGSTIVNGAAVTVELLDGNITIASDDTDLDGRGELDYNYNNSFYVDINFTENLFVENDDNNTKLTYAVINNAFLIEDSVGNELNATIRGYLAGDTYSLSSSSFRSDYEENNTILRLEVDSNITTVGDVYLTFDGSLLKDEAGNSVLSLPKTKIFDDTVNPRISRVDLSFEDTTKGQIIFSEVIDTTDMAKWDIFGSKKKTATTTGNERDYTVTLTKVVDGAFNYSPTVIEFELDSPVYISKSNNDGLSDLNITIEGISDNNLTFRPLTDMGENAINKTDDNAELSVGGSTVTLNYAEGNFTTNDLLVDIVPSEWNLISIPTNKVTTSQHMFVTGTVQTIWGYDNNTWVQSPNIIHSGLGYWVKGLDVTDLNATDRNFSKTQTTSYRARQIVSTTVIENNASQSWKLLGTDAEISWADAHAQVKDLECHTTLIYAYRPVKNIDTRTGTGNTDSVDGNISYTDQISGWNLDSTIPANSGIWVKQENCSAE